MFRSVFRKPTAEPMLSREEMNGVITLIMSIEDGIWRLVRATEAGDEEE